VRIRGRRRQIGKCGRLGYVHWAQSSRRPFLPP
jgi:hypothetical protein